MNRNILPLLPDAIVKIKSGQEPAPDELYVYLIHVKKIPDEEARKLISECYEDGKMKNKKKLAPYLQAQQIKKKA